LPREHRHGATQELVAGQEFEFSDHAVRQDSFEFVADWVSLV